MMIKNLIYNISYQILSLILPLITLPYISRVLGVDGIGEYSFTYSNVQYFVLFGMLGLSMYGSRTIAQSNINKEKLSRTFVEVYGLQAIACLISYVLFIVTFGLRSDIYFAQSFFVLGALLDISWFFIGIEDFKKVVIRNTLVRILGIFLIFLLVKDKDDLLIYTFIMSLTTFVGQVLMWINIQQYITLEKPIIQKSFSHFKPTLLLFLPQIASSVYLLLDRTMLGVIHGDFEVGIYEQGQKIIRLAVALITAISGVMMPRIANMIAMNKVDEMKKTLTISSLFIWIISFGLTFGIAGVSESFVPWFFGEGYSGVTEVLNICSLMIIAIGGANLFAVQYLIPTNQQNKYTVSVIFSAVLNMGLNLILIPQYSYMGAAISTVVAEVAGALVQMYFVRQQLDLRSILSPILKLLLSGLVMYFSIRVISVYLTASLLTTATQVIVGSLVYLVMLFLTKVVTINFIRDSILKKVI